MAKLKLQSFTDTIDGEIFFVIWGVYIVYLKLVKKCFLVVNMYGVYYAFITLLDLRTLVKQLYVGYSSVYLQLLLQINVVKYDFWIIPSILECRETLSTSMYHSIFAFSA